MFHFKCFNSWKICQNPYIDNKSVKIAFDESSKFLRFLKHNHIWFCTKFSKWHDLIFYDDIELSWNWVKICGIHSFDYNLIR